MKVAMLAAMCLVLLIAGAVGSEEAAQREQLLQAQREQLLGEEKAESRRASSSRDDGGHYTPPDDVNPAQISSLQTPEGFPKLTTSPNIDVVPLSRKSFFKKRVRPEDRSFLHQDADLQQAQRDVANHILSTTGDEGLAQASFGQTINAPDVRSILQNGHDTTSAVQNIDRLYRWKKSSVPESQHGDLENKRRDARATAGTKTVFTSLSASPDRPYYQEYVRNALTEGKTPSLDDAYAYSQERTQATGRVGGDGAYGGGEGSPWARIAGDYTSPYPDQLWLKKSTQDVCK